MKQELEKTTALTALEPIYNELKTVQDLKKYEKEDVLPIIWKCQKMGIDLLQKDAYIVEMQLKEKKLVGGVMRESVRIVPQLWLNYKFQQKELVNAANVDKFSGILELDANEVAIYDYEKMRYIIEYTETAITERRFFCQVRMKKDDGTPGEVYNYHLSQREILEALPSNFTDEQKKKYTGAHAKWHCGKHCLRHLLDLLPLDKNLKSTLSMDLYSAVEDVEFQEVKERKLLKAEPIEMVDTETGEVIGIEAEPQVEAEPTPKEEPKKTEKKKNIFDEL